MLMTEKQFEVVGKVLSNQVLVKGNQVDRRVVKIKTKNNTTEVFSAYALQILDANKVKENDLVKIKYKKCGNPISSYNRIDEITKVTSMNDSKTDIIEGILTNLNNVRGYKNKKDNEVCCSLKSNKGKVSYCYIPSNLTKSMFFFKGSYVKLEVLDRPSTDKHQSYEIINMWGNLV